MRIKTGGAAIAGYRPAGMPTVFKIIPRISRNGADWPLRPLGAAGQR
jgi:hypothetical protein